MLKDLNLLMSCSQDNYIREDNFLQVNVDLSFCYPHMRSTSFIPIYQFHALRQEEYRTKIPNSKIISLKTIYGFSSQAICYLNIALFIK